MSESLHEDLSGRTIAAGRFHLLQKLGAGSFGAVYRAQEYALNGALRESAIKLTHRENLTPDSARRELQEGFTLCRLISEAIVRGAHRHFIQVHGMEIAEDLDDRAILVMEYIRGEQLLQHVQSFGNRIPTATAIRYFRQLCTAMDVCHQANPPMTHGDLKPDNILVDETATLRLVDFGLARPIDRLSGYAVNPQGCLAYTAPESLLGRGIPQSDIYSLGLVMYELLAGDGPHLHFPKGPRNASQSHYYRLKQDLQFVPLREANQSWPQNPELFDIVERCCRFDADQRPDSVAGILQALDAIGESAMTHQTDTTPAISERRDSRTETYDRQTADSRGAIPSDSVGIPVEELIVRLRTNPETDDFQNGLALFEETSANLPSRLRRDLGESLQIAARQLEKNDSTYRQWAEFLQDRLS